MRKRFCHFEGFHKIWTYNKYPCPYINIYIKSPDVKHDVLPRLNDVFIASRGMGHKLSKKQMNSYVTFGPLDQHEMQKILEPKSINVRF
jgi:hypothetical protein